MYDKIALDSLMIAATDQTHKSLFVMASVIWDPGPPVAEVAGVITRGLFCFL